MIKLFNLRNVTYIYTLYYIHDIETNEGSFIVTDLKLTVLRINLNPFGCGSLLSFVVNST